MQTMFDQTSDKMSPHNALLPLKNCDGTSCDLIQIPFLIGCFFFRLGKPCWQRWLNNQTFVGNEKVATQYNTDVPPIPCGTEMYDCLAGAS